MYGRFKDHLEAEICRIRDRGLCNGPRVIAAANYAFFRWGFGMASVRFICGAQEVHKELERRMAGFPRDG